MTVDVAFFGRPFFGGTAPLVETDEESFLKRSSQRDSDWQRSFLRSFL